MKKAFKTYSQNEKNVYSVPGALPWKLVEIDDNDQQYYESLGYTVLSESEYDQYLIDQKAIYYKFDLALKVNQYNYLDISIKKRKEFADDLIERLKKRNMQQSINAVQGLWMHQKIRQLNVTLPGAPTFSVDLMNMVVSGDLELACLSLMYSQADDMSLPYHWLSQERINWIIAELKKFLGWP